MANFPTSLDNLTNPQSSDTLDSPSHSTQHINENDIIEALEAKVGVDSSGVSSSHDYKISALEGNVGQSLNTDDSPTFADITIGDAKLGSPTYDSIHDWMNNTQSSGIISGFTMSDSGSGQIDIASGTGILKTTDSAIGTDVFFDYAGTTNVSLIDNSANYVYIDYNSGTPQAGVETSKTKSNRDAFYIGKVYRSGTTLHIVNAGALRSDLARNIQSRFTSTETEFTRASGLIIGDGGSLTITLTQGVVWNGLTRETISAYDSGTTNFTYWYNDGSWQSSATGTISNTQYNDYGTGLATLTSNRYGVHWVYIHDDGDIDVVYGTSDYKLAEAQAAHAPDNLPGITTNFAHLAGKIIIQKDSASFYSLESSFENGVAFTPVSDHGALAGLSDDDHPQYIKDSEFTQDSGVLVGTGAGTFTEETGATLRTSLGLAIGTDVLAEQTIGIADDNLLEVDGSPTDNDYAKFTANGLEGRSYSEVKTDLALSSSDLSDVSSIAMLDENEDIMGKWDFNDEVDFDMPDKEVTSNESNYMRSIDVAINGADISSGITDSGYRIGMQSNILINDANFEGTLSMLYSGLFKFGINNNGPGTITDAYGIKIEPFHEKGTITNSYQLYLSAPSTDAGTVTNEYAIYSADDADSHLEGGLTLGSFDNYALAGDTSNSTQVLRRGRLLVQNGTNAATMKARVQPLYNGDTIAVTDNIGKGATTGDFTLDANGEELLIEETGLTGNVLMAQANISQNASGSDLTVWCTKKGGGNEIRMFIKNSTTGASQDWTSVVDSGGMYIEIIYVTDA